jgi:hypothetical protein
VGLGLAAGDVNDATTAAPTTVPADDLAVRRLWFSGALPGALSTQTSESLRRPPSALTYTR